MKTGSWSARFSKVASGPVTDAGAAGGVLLFARPSEVDTWAYIALAIVLRVCVDRVVLPFPRGLHSRFGRAFPEALAQLGMVVEDPDPRPDALESQLRKASGFFVTGLFLLGLPCLDGAVGFRTETTLRVLVPILAIPCAIGLGACLAAIPIAIARHGLVRHELLLLTVLSPVLAVTLSCLASIMAFLTGQDLPSVAGILLAVPASFLALAPVVEFRASGTTARSARLAALFGGLVAIAAILPVARPDGGDLLSAAFSLALCAAVCLALPPLISVVATRRREA